MKKRSTDKRLFSPNPLIPLSIVVLGLATLTAISLTNQKNQSTRTKANGTSAGAIFNKNISHEIKFFSDTKTYLKSGDVVFITVVRNSVNTPMTTTDQKWTSRVGLVSSVTTPGVHKILLFSAVEDVRNLIGQVPSSVDYIGYNLEGEMSPAADFTDISASVQAFAKIVHASGRKAFFAPIRLTWDVLEREGKLETVLNSVDAVGIQEQKNYQNLSSDVMAKHKVFKSINPNLKIFIQLWLGQQTPQQIIDGHLSIQNYLDVAGIGTYSETEGVITILKGLGRGVPIVTITPTSTPTPTAMPTSTPTPTPTPTQTVVCPQCPDVHLSLFTHAKKKGVKIAWQKISGVDYYSVFRCSGSGCNPDTAITQVDSNKNTYPDTNGGNGYSLGQNIILRYSVRPHKQGCSLPSCSTFEISF